MTEFTRVQHCLLPPGMHQAYTEAPDVVIYLDILGDPVRVTARHLKRADAEHWARWITWLRLGVERGIAFADVKFVRSHEVEV